MIWENSEYPERMDNLDPEVRDRAIAIARDLIVYDGMNEDDAIDMAIIRAEEWVSDEEVNETELMEQIRKEVEEDRELEETWRNRSQRSEAEA